VNGNRLPVTQKAIVVLLSSFLVATAEPPVDRIVVEKAKRTLTLISGTTVVKTYRNIKLGDSPLGHKHFEGDERTPEGRYTINGRNAGSKYHLSLRISYPNPADTAFAKKRGQRPGGDIFIHGQPNGSPAPRLPWDWTDGCIALSNAEIDEVWKLVRTGTRVTIQP
jgi:murein L,D-transpeptidase YafK